MIGDIAILVWSANKQSALRIELERANAQAPKPTLNGPGSLQGPYCKRQKHDKARAQLAPKSLRASLKAPKGSITI